MNYSDGHPDELRHRRQRTQTQRGGRAKMEAETGGRWPQPGSRRQPPGPARGGVTVGAADAGRCWFGADSSNSLPPCGRGLFWTHDTPDARAGHGSPQRGGLRVSPGQVCQTAAAGVPGSSHRQPCCNSRLGVCWVHFTQASECPASVPILQRWSHLPQVSQREPRAAGPSHNTSL